MAARSSSAQRRPRVGRAAVATVPSSRRAASRLATWSPKRLSQSCGSGAQPPPSSGTTPSPSRQAATTAAALARRGRAGRAARGRRGLEGHVEAVAVELDAGHQRSLADAAGGARIGPAAGEAPDAVDQPVRVAAADHDAPPRHQVELVAELDHQLSFARLVAERDLAPEVDEPPGVDARARGARRRRAFGSTSRRSSSCARSNAIRGGSPRSVRGTRRLSMRTGRRCSSSGRTRVTSSPRPPRSKARSSGSRSQRAPQSSSSPAGASSSSRRATPAATTCTPRGALIAAARRPRGR